MVIDIVFTIIDFGLLAFSVIYCIYTSIAIYKRKKAGIGEMRSPITITIFVTVLGLILMILICVSYFNSKITAQKYHNTLLIPLLVFACVLWDTYRVTIEGDKVAVRIFFHVKYYPLKDIVLSGGMVYYNGKKIFSLPGRYLIATPTFMWEIRQRTKCSFIKKE